MVKHTAICRSNCNNILDLPVELIRLIFGHMTDAEVYFNLRCVCTLLRSYAEDYVQIGKSIKQNLKNENVFFFMLI